MSGAARPRERATVPAIVTSAAERCGDRPAVMDGDERLTYGELAGRVRAFGAGLVAAGVAPGDRVAVWAFNCTEWIVAALGVSEAGCVLVPVNTRFKGAEAADLLARARAKVLVTVTDFLGTDYVALLRETAADLPDLATVVVARGHAVEGTVPWEAFLDGAGEDDRAEVGRRAAAVSPDDPSDILFTSGTTGVPKGVVQTQASTTRVAADWVAMTGLGTGDRYLMVNPFFHMFGLKAGILAAVTAGATMLPVAVFDAGSVLATVAEEGVTVLPGAPTLYQSLLDHPGRGDHDLTSLRVAVTGAADIPVELVRRIHAELPFSLIVTGYGLTEAGTATATSPGDGIEAIATTVGRPRPGFELRLVDGAGEEAGPGEPGEILLRGGSILSHYLDDPEATARATSADGWLRTGDIGLLDDDGRLRIVGRSKDLFIVGGFNAYPAEIENGLLRHPDICEAAVVGIPDTRLGEVGRAFVVVRPGAAVTGADVVAWCRDRMANYKVPRVVEVVDDLPRNATGKVEKAVLRARPVPGRTGSPA